MTTTAFQYVIDNAEQISIDSKPTVGQTIARDFTVRSVVHGTAKKRFTVKLPDGMRWSLAHSYITAIETAGKYTQGTITISPSTFGAWFEPSATNTYTVYCTSLPQWTVFARDQVSWSGPFVFIEA